MLVKLPSTSSLTNVFRCGIQKYVRKDDNSSWSSALTENENKTKQEREDNNTKKDATFSGTETTSPDSHLSFSTTASQATRDEILTSFSVHCDFVTPAEELQLLKEADRHLQLLRYQFRHWDDLIVGRVLLRDVWGLVLLTGVWGLVLLRDVWGLRKLASLQEYRDAWRWFVEDVFHHVSVSQKISCFYSKISRSQKSVAIEGYRETEVARWSRGSEAVLERLRARAFGDARRVLVHTHVLDLAREGYIKPHVDSVRFCGSTIAGLSLGSVAVMRLVKEGENDQSVDILLPARSLYIMRDASRYLYTHEVLQEAQFRGQAVNKDRRVSIICRNHPPAQVQDAS
ncbi:Alpha-ketoglutarate-dependent dioxygenase AlkB-like [Trinorchestia longiramus]|nr:Alpha-ketoglutarate-dependent dioxygenase AlkB-like [Trinorchestia longiramus]